VVTGVFYASSLCTCVNVTSQQHTNQNCNKLIGILLTEQLTFPQRLNIKPSTKSRMDITLFSPSDSRDH